jgi:serine O-acetyltransferase
MRTLFRTLFEAGYQAVLLYRISNWLYRRTAFRLFSYFFSRFNLWFTGVDIHPGATIGRRFVIPHPVGIVIGGDSVIGDDCVIMHGVTLGAKGHGMKGTRHPKVGDRVTIYCNATVLGSIDIGEDSTIGAHALVTKRVPARSVVINKNQPVSTENEGYQHA